MTILSCVLAQLIVFGVAAVLVTWTRPQWLKTIAAILCRIADASIAAREVFSQPAAAIAPKVSKRAAPEIMPELPFFADVTSALVNLGTTPAAAKTATRKAIMSPELSPEAHNFESIFKLALQFAR